MACAWGRGNFSLGVLGGGGRFACLFGWLVFFLMRNCVHVMYT